MGKFASAVKAGPPRKGHWCDMCAFIESLDSESRDEILSMLRNDEWGNKAIAEEVAEHLPGIDARIVDVHRKSRAARG